MTIEFYNIIHVFVLLFVVAFCIVFPLSIKKLSSKSKDKILLLLAIFNIMLYFIKIAFIYKKPWFDIFDDLPLDICGINLFICLFAIIFKKEYLYNYLYFIGSLGGAAALLMPNGPFLNCNLFEPVTFIYYLQHMILATFPIILIILGYFRPKLSSIWKNTIIFVISSIVMYGIDKLIFILTGTKANYFFLVYSPHNPFLDILWEINPHEFVYALPCLILLVVVNLLMCLPFKLNKIFYKKEKLTKYKKGAGNWYKSDAFLVGKYLSYQENNMMVSKSGKATSQNYSALQWTTYAKANGEGYKPYGYYEHTILAFLWLIEFANKRSTNIINGYSSYNQTTGGTDSIETSTGYLTANSRMKYRGIEDFIGNDAVWMPDVTGAYYTSRDVETYKNGATNKTQLSYYMNITVSSSWRGIQALGWDDNNPFICLPSKLGSASSTTYFGTNMYGPNGSNEYLSRNKIYSGYSSNCNLLSPVFDYQFSNASSTTTSRLIKYEI